MAGKRTTNNTVTSVKNNKEAYTNYIREIPKGLGIDLMPGGSIVNTAYKGQKTVQSHVLSGNSV